MAPNGTGPQVLDYEGVVWGPRPGQMRKLKPLPGDTVSIATWINDNGQAVGASGTCGNSENSPVAYGAHAVLWDAIGNPRNLGNVGSTAVNAGLSINNRGEVAGASSPTDQRHPSIEVWRSSGLHKRGCGPLVLFQAMWRASRQELTTGEK